MKKNQQTIIIAHHVIGDERLGAFLVRGRKSGNAIGTKMYQRQNNIAPELWRHVNSNRKRGTSKWKFNTSNMWKDTRKTVTWQLVFSKFSGIYRQGKSFIFHAGHAGGRRGRPRESTRWSDRELADDCCLRVRHRLPWQPALLPSASPKEGCRPKEGSDPWWKGGRVENLGPPKSENYRAIRGKW